MNNCDCSICENHEYEMPDRMNLEEMLEFTKGDKKFIDGRRGLLTLYNYCPFCGKKIDWVDIRKMFNTYKN